MCFVLWDSASTLKVDTTGEGGGCVVCLGWTDAPDFKLQTPQSRCVDMPLCDLACLMTAGENVSGSNHWWSLHPAGYSFLSSRLYYWWIIINIDKTLSSSIKRLWHVHAACRRDDSGERKHASPAKTDHSVTAADPKLGNRGAEG